MPVVAGRLVSKASQRWFFQALEMQRRKLIRRYWLILLLSLRALVGLCLPNNEKLLSNDGKKASKFLSYLQIMVFKR